MSDNVYIFDWNRAARLINKYKPQRAYAFISGLQEHTEVTIWVEGKIIPHAPSLLINFGPFLMLRLDGCLHNCSIKLSETDGWGCATWWPKSAVEILKSKKTVMEEFLGPWIFENIDVLDNTGELIAVIFEDNGKPMLAALDMLEALEIANEFNEVIRSILLDYARRNVVASKWDMLELWDEFRNKSQAAIKKARGKI